MGNPRLTSLLMLSIECELAMNISFKDLLRKLRSKVGTEKSFFKH